MVRCAYLICTVGVFAIAVGTLNVARRPVTYTPDSLIYARMMLSDLHVGQRETTLRCRKFFNAEFASQPSFLPFVDAHPPKLFLDQTSLFVSRPIYPYVGSRFYGRLGFAALPFVSSAAYVLAAVALFWLLCSFARAPVAATVTIAAIILPVSYPSALDLATYALTDLLALVFVLLTLLAQVRYTARGSNPWLVLSLACACVLALTRPAIYLVDGSAIAVLVFGWFRSDRAYVRRGLALTCVTVTVTLAYEVYSYIIGAPGLSGQFAYYYERHMSTGTHKDVAPAVWYVLQVIRMVAYETWAVLTRPVALLAVGLGLLGLYLDRGKVEMACVIGAMLSLPLAILTHPVPGDAGRTIEVPMIPILAVGFACTFNHGKSRLSRSVRRV